MLVEEIHASLVEDQARRKGSLARHAGPAPKRNRSFAGWRRRREPAIDHETVLIVRKAGRGWVACAVSVVRRLADARVARNRLRKAGSIWRGMRTSPTRVCRGAERSDTPTAPPRQPGQYARGEKGIVAAKKPTKTEKKVAEAFHEVKANPPSTLGTNQTKGSARRRPWR